MLAELFNFVWLKIERGQLFGSKQIEMTTEQTKEEIKYRVKIVTIGSRTTPIILQNYNGPCPLIAVANALLLQGKRLGIDPKQKFVSNDHLLQILATFLLEYNPTNDDTQDSEPVKISIQDALELLPKIKDGLDVNVRFNGITSFESRPEVELFNLLKLKLVHGWIIDPQDAETASVLDDLTYNQVIEKFLLMEDLIIAESKATAEENTKVLNAQMHTNHFLKQKNQNIYLSNH